MNWRQLPNDCATNGHNWVKDTTIEWDRWFCIKCDTVRQEYEPILADEDCGKNSKEHDWLPSPRGGERWFCPDCGRLRVEYEVR